MEPCGGALFRDVVWRPTAGIMRLMRRRLHPVAAEGFTLIELLVALTLMALLSVILFGGLRFGIRAWETGGRNLEEAGRIEAVQSLLRRELRQARFLPQKDNAGPVAPFKGDANSLVFIAPVPDPAGVGGSDLFRLALHESNNRSALTLAWRLYRPELLASDHQIFDDGTVLIGDIASIELSYYGAPGPQLPVQWWDKWDGSSGRPQLIRLRMEFPPGDRRRWPDLIIRVLDAAS